MKDNKWVEFWNNKKDLSFQDKVTHLLLAINQGDKEAEALLQLLDEKGAMKEDEKI